MSDIHSRIKRHRKKSGLSMQALAERLGVNWQTVQQWENGRTAPKRTNLVPLAKELGVSPEYLWSGMLSMQGTAEQPDLAPGGNGWPFPRISRRRIEELSAPEVELVEDAMLVLLKALDAKPQGYR